jgi:hypothetical protein
VFLKLIRFWEIIWFIVLGTFLLNIIPKHSYTEPQTTLFSSEETINYAFATQTGSGIYRINGSTIQIYRISGSIRIYTPHSPTGTLRLRLPATFGFYNFKIEEIFDKGLPENIATFTLIPQLEFQIPLKKNWEIIPFVGIGSGKDFSTNEIPIIWDIGIRNLTIFPKNRYNIRLGNRFVYSGYSSKNLNFTDDFGLFENGIDIRRQLHFSINKKQIDGGLFLVNYLYLKSPHLLQFKNNYSSIKSEWELGITFGAVTKWSLFRIRMPRFGLSYRFGGKLNAIRFIIGNPFPIDLPDEEGPRMD